MSEQVTLEDIQTIIKLVRDAENVAEFSLKYGELEISLSRNARAGEAAEPTPPRKPSASNAGPAAVAIPAAADPSATDRASPQAAPGSKSAEPSEGEIAIRAPMVGTFYRSPKPGEPPFVEEGQAVGKESVLCIIEVMKLMNSLQAGVEGTVTRILVEDAQAVEYGQPLMFVRKDAL